MAEVDQPDLTSLTVQLLSAYVANNSVASEDLAGLIQATRKALAGEQAFVEPETPEYQPAVSVRKSLSSRDSLISLIDGKSYKTLKRHLATHGLTPDQYRQRYNLARDYPMVAPAFAEQRRQIAERIGLGRKPGAQPPAVANAADEMLAAPASPAPLDVEAGVPKAKRARPAKIAEPATVEAAAEQAVAVIDAVKRRSRKASAATIAKADAPKSAPAKGRKKAVAASIPAVASPTHDFAAPELSQKSKEKAKRAPRAKLKLATGSKSDAATPKRAGRPRKSADTSQG